MSKKNVVADVNILAVGCPTCNVPPNEICVDTVISGTTLKKASSRRFHPARIMIAQEEQMVRLFGSHLTNGKKWLICAYAYIFISDSVASFSQAIMGKELTSVEIQTFFAKMAAEELHKDGLLSERAMTPPTHDTSN